MLELINRSALAVNPSVIYHCWEVNCKVDYALFLLWFILTYFCLFWRFVRIA